MSIDPRGIVRTVVPIIVGWLLAQPVVAAVGVTEEQLVAVVTVLVQVGYYLAARGLERFRPRFGVLLGWIGEPSYIPRHAAE